jgi:hypothetical protein
MLPGRRDAEGRLYVTSAAIDATTTYQGGIPITPLGQVIVDINTPQKFQNGFGMMNSKKLCINNALPIAYYLEGIPRAINGAIRIQLNQVPAATDPFVGGLRIGPLGGVYVTDEVPS